MAMEKLASWALAFLVEALLLDVTQEQVREEDLAGEPDGLRAGTYLLSGGRSGAN